MSEGDILVVEAMRDPATYGEEMGAGTIEERQTHISWLFFTPQHVYKVKKPVELGFLDFSTLERRRHFCHEELRLNRRLSPDVYQAVVAICAGSGPAQLRQDPEPETEPPAGIVDYAVRMRRLPEDRWLLRLLEADRADRRLMHRIAHRLVGFHALAETDEEITRLGSLESVCRNTEENFRQTADLVGETLEAPVRDAVIAWTEAFQDLRKPVFRQREGEGRIRDGHGDLHCAQICVENGIDFIDCIEFNRRFRCADVAADLAFTSMDLKFHGHAELADALVLEYMARSGDVGLVRLLPFYECYRAYTRGKVESMRLRQEDGEDDGFDRAGSADRARRYFRLAWSYARPRRAALLITCGPMASGKSTLAAALAERLGGVVLRSDVVRKELAGIDPRETRADSWAEGLYDAETTARTYGELHDRALRLLRAGQVVILDASYRERARREAAREIAVGTGIPVLLLRACSAEATLRRRLEARQRLGDVSDGRPELLGAQLQAWEPPDEVPAEERIDVDTEVPPEEAARAALAAVYRRLLAGASGGR